MKFEDKFKNILQDNEKVVDITTASKRGYLLKRLMFPLTLFVVVTIVLSIIAGVFGDKGFPLWVLFVVSGALLLLAIIVLLVSYKSSKNYFVCLTDKRIIVRYGAFATDYSSYSIEKVSGNIDIQCNKSIFDKENDCALYVKIELLPVGHNASVVFLSSIANGYEFSKKIDKQIKENAKALTEKVVEE